MENHLKFPAKAYPERLVRFMNLLETVRKQGAGGMPLWEVMDSVAFADTEAALQTALYNHRQQAASARRGA